MSLGISRWAKANTAPLQQLKRRGLLIAFTEPMAGDTLDNLTVEVFLRAPEQLPGGIAGYHWAGLVCDVKPIGWKVECGGDVNADFEDAPPPDEITGVQIVPRGEGKGWTPGQYMVVLHGDAILAFADGPRLDGTVGPRTLDGNHLGPGLPKRCPTGDLIEGGAFESWFRID